MGRRRSRLGRQDAPSKGSDALEARVARVVTALEKVN